MGDVGTRGEAPVIEIRAGDDQDLKTASSRRAVPIHSELVALGFLEYVEEARKRDWNWLFLELHTGGPNGPGGIVSKFFTRWRRKVGVDDPKKVFHSFRHTVIDRLKNADVQEHMIAEVVGHENDNITTGRYGQKPDVGKLAEMIERLDYGDALKGLR